VRRYYRCPSFSTEPLEYLRFLAERLRVGDYDVLFPVHDQVYLLSRVRETLERRVGVALPSFEAVSQLQSKARFSELLQTLGLPQPATTVLHGVPEIDSRSWQFPFYLKLEYSTAGCGVWFVRDRNELLQVLDRLRASRGDDGIPPILMQQPAKGTFCVTQSVFRHGQLLAAHSYKSRACGVGGSAYARESVDHGVVAEHLKLLGAHLNWHGALHVEYFVDPTSGAPTYIEANPRIGETLNATLSGTNLCEELLHVSSGDAGSPQTASRSGVITHSVLTSLLAICQRGQGRRAVLAELSKACCKRGVYRGSTDELTRPIVDPCSLIPAVAVTLQLLTKPGRVHHLVGNVVEQYSLNRDAVMRIKQISSEELARCLGGQERADEL
jgi:predicted ATP-grasp superfamily ATP-dependent carboligase